MISAMQLNQEIKENNKVSNAVTLLVSNKLGRIAINDENNNGHIK